MLRIGQQAYITRRFYGHEESLGRQAQRAGEQARELAKKDGGGGGLFGQAKRDLGGRQGRPADAGDGAGGKAERGAAHRRGRGRASGRRRRRIDRRRPGKAAAGRNRPAVGRREAAEGKSGKKRGADGAQGARRRRRRCLARSTKEWMMEWVETTARTVEEAKELALDQLGVVADEAEFEVLEEPQPGLFGRLRGEARVRARVRRRRCARSRIAAEDAAARAAADTDGRPPTTPARRRGDGPPAATRRRRNAAPSRPPSPARTGRDRRAADPSTEGAP